MLMMTLSAIFFYKSTLIIIQMSIFKAGFHILRTVEEVVVILTSFLQPLYELGMVTFVHILAANLSPFVWNYVTVILRHLVHES